MTIKQQFDTFVLERMALLRDLVLPLDTTNRYWKPEPTAWSTLEVFEHLVLVDELVVAQAPTDERVGSRLRGRLAVRLMRIASAAGARVRVPLAAITPRQRPDIDEVLERCSRVQFRLRDLLWQHRDRAASAVLLTHPVAGPLCVEDGVDFLVEHQRHHRRQLERLAKMRKLAGVPPPARFGGA